jgi:hypothetical protein
MISSLTELATLLNEGDNETKVENIRESIAESIEEIIEEDELFFSLPTNEITKIIQKSDISNAETYSNIISRLCEAKGGEAALILNVIEAKEANFEECVRIVSSLKCSPVCVRLGDLYKENENQPEFDYEHEIFWLKKEIEELKQQRRTIFKPVTEKPSDFESDIYVAARKGKLTSVQYLIEQHKANAGANDDKGSTPLYYASENGHIAVVRYLIERCSVNVEAEGIYRSTPLHFASNNGHIEVVKYLIEQCHANVEAKDINGWTPLHYTSGKGYVELVKYLIEQ